MALGTLTGGWRIVHTMGSKITRLSPQQGFCAETGGAITLFLATGLSHGEATPDGTEQLVVRWLPFADVVAMTLDGRITDAMTVVAVERLALLRALEAPRG